MGDVMKDYKDIKFQVEDGIGFITLNRPDKRNAFSMNLMTEDSQEGISAFLQKRTQQWKGK